MLKGFVVKYLSPIGLSFIFSLLDTVTLSALLCIADLIRPYSGRVMLDTHAMGCLS